MSAQEKALRCVKVTLEVALSNSRDPRDWCVEIPKTKTRGLLRRINNALKPHPLSRKQWIESRTAV